MHPYLLDTASSPLVAFLKGVPSSSSPRAAEKQKWYPYFLKKMFSTLSALMVVAMDLEERV